MVRNRDQDTICAVSTPPGFGGISVIRVSGSNSFKVIKSISSKLPNSLESHRVYLTTILDSERQSIDECLVTCFAHGKSFTGEEVVEISCHGNPLICDRILASLFKAGCRPADRGEFTYRAFMNGKLDLVQAESVLSLIESKSHQAQQLALRQLKGKTSDSILDIEDKIIWSLAHIEASIDFSTENLEVVSDQILKTKISEIKTILEKIVQGYKQGRLIREGVQVAFVGSPNVGKSSLLNFLVEEDKAIVTDVAGTTRDLVEADYNFNGLTFHFVDTAGLRDSTDDAVEKIGISRSKGISRSADILIFVFDFSVGLTFDDEKQLISLQRAPDLIFANKCDLIDGSNQNRLDVLSKIQSIISLNSENLIFTSSKISENRETLLAEVYKKAIGSVPVSENYISTSRQFESLSLAIESLNKALDEINSSIGCEFLAISLKEALLRVQEVLGKSYDDQILDRVFKEFCLGK